MHSESRSEALGTFYRLLSELERRCGGKRRLADCSGRLPWPQRGVYFFFEDGEHRQPPHEHELRVVRVGTHAITKHSKSTLWQRLMQHRGPLNGGAGNHRGSIFRSCIGDAWCNREPAAAIRSWGVAADPSQAARRFGITRSELLASEKPLEMLVSCYVGRMSLLWLDADDSPAPDCERAVIERDAVALLSNFAKPPNDPPSPYWLGRHSSRAAIRDSGLWNNHFVDAVPDHPRFLALLGRLVGAQGNGESGTVRF